MNFPIMKPHEHDVKSTQYEFDLISGNMTKVKYQNGEVDQWHHAYTYDADNRIKEVYTNTHAPFTEMFDFTQNKQAEFILNSDWQEDARYYYYDHGPLARAEIGENLLQGVDYYYNLQGWLKGVNSSVLLDENDPGKDSDPNSLNNFFGKDVFGFGLYYYNGDYEAIGGASTNAATSPIAPVDNSSHAALNSFDLYNGNIRYMQTAIVNPTTRDAMPMLNAYNYDQLNRLKESRSYESGLSTNSWNPNSYNDEYFNAFTFDAMGNILYQERHKQDGTEIEDLTYHYQRDADSNLVRNRLYHINDSIDSTIVATDIDDMGIFYDNNNIINTDNNYSYDAEGRLVRDRQEEIDTIIWTVSGKVKEIRRDLASNKKNVSFDYDAMGNRIAKHVYDNQTQMLEKSTYYILDAQGNQMSMYEHDVASTSVNYYLAERNIYGSSRLGTTRDRINMFLPNTLPSYGVVGNRNYEMSNHLGNVLAVINDVIYPLSSDDGNITSYETGLLQVSDYSPFGVQLDGRTISNGDYRYGFQGQEMDDEVKGKGNSINYKYRMHDPRVGRFFAVDPLAPKYPHNSPYAFSENRVLDAVELEGLEKFQIVKRDEKLIMTLVKVDADFVVNDYSQGELQVHKNYVYSDFNSQMKDADINKYTGTVIAPNVRNKNKTEFRNPNSNPGDPLTPEFTISTKDKSLVKEKIIDGSGLFSSDFDSPENALNAFDGLSVPDDYDLVKVYHSEEYNREDVVNALEGQGVDVKNKDIIFTEKPFDVVTMEPREEDPNVEKELNVVFGNYE